MAILKNLPPDAQTQVLWLHHEAFGGDSACKQCPGNCCRACSHSDGYLRMLRNGETYEEEDARVKATKEKYGWTNDAGFRGEHGCKLPLTERSDICLGYMCSGRGFLPQEELPMNPPRGVNKPFDAARREASNRIYDLMNPRKRG